MQNLIPTIKEIINKVIETMPCALKLKPGYITKTEPKTKPIIAKYVYDFAILNRKFIKTKNIIPPIANPMPMGIKIDKFKLAIAEI